ncbi:MAG: acyltransferase [Burkholderiales bacterium]|nr:acyltransferase [Burkholderiales bacterium]
MTALAEPDARTAPAMSGAASAYLDAVRAIAANVVVVSHVLLVYVGGSSMGAAAFAVALFFLLSGFLITQSMLNWQSRPQPRLGGFLADRVARILTPYVPALLLVVAANAFFISSKWGEPGVNSGALAFLGNLLMLQDHSAFQLLAILHVDVPWRIRPYNAAEPFWTVSIEMWIYVATGLFFFCVLGHERIRRRVLWPLVALSVPVVVWNAAAGGGKSLTLIWLLGAVAGWAIAGLSASGGRRTAWLAIWLVALGAAGLGGRIAKVGFDAYELQTAALIAMLVFGVLIGLARVPSVPPLLERGCRFLASYSYSLYLIHNTVLIAAFEATQDMPRWLSIPLGVLLSHAVAIALYWAFERHHRRVAQWLRPRFARAIAPPVAATGRAATAPLFRSAPH